MIETSGSHSNLLDPAVTALPYAGSAGGLRIGLAQASTQWQDPWECGAMANAWWWVKIAVRRIFSHGKTFFLDTQRIFLQETKRSYNLCSNSVLLNKDREALSRFSWDDITQELKLKSPLLHAMLESCLPKAMGLDIQVIIGTCICVLAKSRRSSASLLQRVVSLILYQGHAGKQVSKYLCVSLVP